jgi:hypothetical protein
MTPIVSTLPDGTVELVTDEAILLDLANEPVMRFDELPGNLAGDAMLCHADRLTGDPYPVVGRDIRVQARYIRMRMNGQSHRMAEMLATRSFPALRTDTEFNKGRCNGNQFEGCPARGDWLRAQAEAAGVSTTGKYYSSALAEYPGDPRAWISDRGDVLRVARENGMTVRGAVEYTPPECEPKADVAVAPDILHREAGEYVARNGGRVEDAAEKLAPILAGQVDTSGDLAA